MAKQDLLFVQGIPGAGKSLFNLHVERTLWEQTEVRTTPRARAHLVRLWLGAKRPLIEKNYSEFVTALQARSARVVFADRIS